MMGFSFLHSSFLRLPVGELVLCARCCLWRRGLHASTSPPSWNLEESACRATDLWYESLSVCVSASVGGGIRRARQVERTRNTWVPWFPCTLLPAWRVAPGWRRWGRTGKPRGQMSVNLNWNAFLLRSWNHSGHWLEHQGCWRSEVLVWPFIAILWAFRLTGAWSWVTPRGRLSPWSWFSCVVPPKKSRDLHCPNGVQCLVVFYAPF